MPQQKKPLCVMPGTSHRLVVEQLEQRLAMDGALGQFCLSNEVELPSSIPASELRLEHFLAAKGLLQDAESIDIRHDTEDDSLLAASIEGQADDALTASFAEMAGFGVSRVVRDKDRMEAEGEGPGPMDFVSGRPTPNRPIATVFDPSFGIDRSQPIGPFQSNNTSIGSEIGQSSMVVSLGNRPLETNPVRQLGNSPSPSSEASVLRMPSIGSSLSESSNPLSLDRVFSSYSNLIGPSTTNEYDAEAIPTLPSDSLFDHPWMNSLQNPVVTAALGVAVSDGGLEHASYRQDDSSSVVSLSSWQLIAEPSSTKTPTLTSKERRDRTIVSNERALLQQASWERSHRLRRDLTVRGNLGRHVPIVIHPGIPSGTIPFDFDRDEWIASNDLSGTGMHRSSGIQTSDRSGTRQPSIWEMNSKESLANENVLPEDQAFNTGTVASEDREGVAYAYAPGFFVVFCGVAWLATSRKRMRHHEDADGSALTQLKDDPASHRSW